MSITADEIASQPEVWARALSDLGPAIAELTAPGETMLVLGCGTSAYVAESFAFLREQAGFGVTDAAYASEPWTWRDWDRVLLITRSGTTSEVLDALDRIPVGVRTIAVTGVAESPVAARVDAVLLFDYADERSVVQTRFPTTFLVAARAALGEDLAGLPGELAAVLDRPLGIDPAAHDHFVYLGSGWTHGLAQEAALKIRESAQAWAESYPLLDYRHGPIAVAHPGSLVWTFGPAAADFVDDIRATGGDVRVGTADPLVELVQAQRLAVAVASSRGLNPDAPRHLTRSIILS